MAIHNLNLTRLNERQRQAVVHDQGPLLILAGAGSGKTNTMAHRIAYLVATKRAKPGSILGLSFTNKAAKELKERVSKMIQRATKQKQVKGLRISTFHSLCVRILREYSQTLGYPKNFSIIDGNDQLEILRGILRQIHIDDRQFKPQWLLSEISRAKNGFLSPDQAATYFLEKSPFAKSAPDYAEACAVAYPKYQEKLRLQQAMDFDDLLFNAVRLLEEHKDIRSYYNRLFKYILVDEYQDTNGAQFRLLQALTESHKNICVVGDDDQSIYSWRGADPSHILNFNKYYPTAKTITLDQNYRCTETILNAANPVIAQNKNRYPKKLWSNLGQGEPILQIIGEDDPDEGDIVAEKIFAMAKERARPTDPTSTYRPWKDFAILFRSNPQARIFEQSLRSMTIPYKIVGSMSFLDRKEVKDVLSYWRLILNPNDDAAFRRIINWPPRGIGRGSLDPLYKKAVETGNSLSNSLPLLVDTFAPKVQKGFQNFVTLVDELRAQLDQLLADPTRVSEWAAHSLAQIGVQNAIRVEEKDDPKKSALRIDIVDELCQGIGRMKTTGKSGADLLREYLTQLTLEQEEQEESDEDQNENQVTLLTLHGAKGLEFPIVFLVGMEDGFLPHQKTIDEGQDLSEERRLCYVGITRAKEQLILTRTKNRIRYGKPVPRNPSRFLEDIPQELIVKDDRSGSPDPDDPASVEAHEKKVTSFLDSIRAQLSQ